MGNRIDSLVGPAEVSERQVLLEESITLEERTADLTQLRNNHMHQAVTCLQLGDLAGFDTARKQTERIGEESRSWIALSASSSFAALLALLEGRFDQVEGLAQQTLEHAHGDADFLDLYAGQLVQLRREQGRMHEVKPLLITAVKDQGAEVVAFRAALALAHVELGELEDARAEFDLLAVDEFGCVPTDLNGTVSLAILSEVAAHLIDAEHAVRLYDLLRPHSGHMVVAGLGAACPGAADRFLGMLAATIQDWEKAEEHFDAALALENKIESPPLLARTQTWYARMLIARGSSGDHERARELLGSALSTAESLGMAGLVAQCQAMLDR